MRKIQQLAFVALLLLANGISHAEQVTFSINAEIDHIYDPNNVLAEKLKLGDRLSSTYTFNTAIADSAPSTLYGFYNQLSNKGNGFSLNIESLSRSPISPRNVVFNSINTWNSSGDFYYAESKMRATAGNGITITFIGLEVFDVTGQALSDDKLTRVPPNITFARDKNLLISGTKAGAMEDFEIRAKIISIANFNDTRTVANQDY